MAMEEDASWLMAVRGARQVVEGLDELVRLQELLDAAGEGTWRLVEILLEKLPGRPLPLYERNHVEDAWARNVVVVAEEGASEGKLQLPTGDVIDEDDTPGGRLPLHEGDNSLRAEYGLFSTSAACGRQSTWYLSCAGGSAARKNSCSSCSRVSTSSMLTTRRLTKRLFSRMRPVNSSRRGTSSSMISSPTMRGSACGNSAGTIGSTGKTVKS